MNNDSERLDRTLVALLAAVGRWSTVQADSQADFLAGIGYEAADPALLGMQWQAAVPTIMAKKRDAE